LKRAAELQGRWLRFSAEDQQRFAEALIQPPAPNAALNEAKRLHLENVEVR